MADRIDDKIKQANEEPLVSESTYEMGSSLGELASDVAGFFTGKSEHQIFREGEERAAKDLQTKKEKEQDIQGHQKKLQEAELELQPDDLFKRIASQIPSKDPDDYSVKEAENFATGDDVKIKERDKTTDPEVLESVEELGERMGKDYLDNKREYLDTVDLGRNYQDVMIGLDEQLKREDEELLADMEDAKKDKAFKSLLIAGINVFAQLYAVQKGIEYKASGIHQKELREDLQDKIDTIKIKRAQLAKRISSAKQLVDTTYRQRKSAEYRKDAISERDDRRRDAEIIKAHERRIKQTADAANYAAAVAAKERQFLTTFNKMSKNEQVEMLMQFGKTKQEAEKMAGIDQGWAWFDEDPKMKEVRAALRIQAMKEVRRPVSLFNAPAAVPATPEQQSAASVQQTTASSETYPTITKQKLEERQQTEKAVQVSVNGVIQKGIVKLGNQKYRVVE